MFEVRAQVVPPSVVRYKKFDPVYSVDGSFGSIVSGLVNGRLSPFWNGGVTSVNVLKPSVDRKMREL